MTQQESFGNRLQELFKPDETQEEFGKRVGGINRNTIASYLKNKDKKPDTDILIKISRACNVSTDWLLGLTDQKTPDINLRAVCEYTGLSEKSVEILHSHSEIANAIVTVIDNEYGFLLCGMISQYMQQTFPEYPQAYISADDPNSPQILLSPDMIENVVFENAIRPIIQNMRKPFIIKKRGDSNA